MDHWGGEEVSGRVHAHPIDQRHEQQGHQQVHGGTGNEDVEPLKNRLCCVIPRVVRVLIVHVLPEKLDVAADRNPRQAILRFADLLADEFGGKPDGEGLHPDSNMTSRKVMPHLVNKDEES